MLKIGSEQKWTGNTKGTEAGTHEQFFEAKKKGGCIEWADCGREKSCIRSHEEKLAKKGAQSYFLQV